MKLRFLLIALCVSFVANAAADETKEETFEYVVKAGDDCGSVSKKAYGTEGRYDLVHKYNNLGPKPHKLKPGQVLILPKAKTLADAVLSKKKGDVDARSPSDTAWKDAIRGMDLFRAWKVGSNQEASAEITFQDNSAVYMKENTVVVIYGETSTQAKKTEENISSAHLEQGTLRSQLGALSGKKVTITTPSSETQLAQGSAVINVEQSGTTRVSNHEGKSAQVKSNKKKGKSVDVKPGMGSKIEPNKAPTTPKPLPAAPVWGKSQDAFATSDKGGDLSGSWSSVASASSYRLELFNANDNELLRQLEVQSTVTSFLFREVPVGKYYIRVSTIDNDKFESLPSAKLLLSVVSFSFGGPSLQDANNGKIPVGSNIITPDGYICFLPNGAAGTSLKVKEPGIITITCKNHNGSSVPVQVQVYEAQIAPKMRVLLPMIPEEYRF